MRNMLCVLLNKLATVNKLLNLFLAVNILKKKFMLSYVHEKITQRYYFVVGRLRIRRRGIFKVLS